MYIYCFTKKKFLVEPVRLAPYFTPPLFSAKSSTLSIRLVGFSIVKKAAKLAVYEETTIKQKNHYIDATVRVDRALRKLTIFDN